MDGQRTGPSGSGWQGRSSGGTGGDGVIRVVVAGDRGTGKTSLIVACLTETFPDSPPPVLPPTRLPQDLFPDKVPVVLIDTSSRKEDLVGVEEELVRADAVVLTYACDKAVTLESLTGYWLPMLRRLQLSAPVIVAGCKLDLRTAAGDSAQAGGAALAQSAAQGEQAGSLEAEMGPIMSQFPEVETCLECSALARVQVREVFYYAQRAVVHPTSPLFDTENNCLRPRCVRALKRIFQLCDLDQDSMLNDDELNSFQVACFSAPLQDEELKGVKRLIASRMPDGISPTGAVTLHGFLFLHALFIERGRLETTWAVLRRFGYTDELELRGDLLQNPALQRRRPDQSVELSLSALNFLLQRFAAVDSDHDGVLTPSEVESLFSTAPYNPLHLPPYSACSKDAPDGRQSLQSFLAKWSLLTLLDPPLALEHLLYLGYPLDQAPGALLITRRRRADRSAGSSQRRVVLCNVFGPPDAGKSHLLDALCEKPFTSTHAFTREDRYTVALMPPTAANATSDVSGRVSWSDNGVAEQEFSSLLSSKVLVLREVADGNVPAVLDNPDSLAAADVTMLVYDSSSSQSWEGAVYLLERLAARAEAQGNEAPCILVAAKDDLGADSKVFPHSARVCAEMGVRAPIPVSARLGDTFQLWSQLLQAASRPHLGVPETSASRAQRRRLYRSLTIVGASTVVAVIVIVGYRMLSRKSSQQ